MKIAVTSQNRKTVTGHAGRCLKFWVYDTVGAEVRSKTLLELPIEQSFHTTHGAPHPWMTSTCSSPAAWDRGCSNA